MRKCANRIEGTGLDLCEPSICASVQALPLDFDQKKAAKPSMFLSRLQMWIAVSVWQDNVN